jgi:polar amino acid transport system substrate-binding protein
MKPIDAVLLAAVVGLTVTTTAALAVVPPAFDPSTVSTDPALKAKLPPSIAKAGVLTVGSDTSYAPWEFLSETDGQTPEGIDVDLANALARKLGVGVKFESSQFDAILPAIGSKYDLGISAFTISKERYDAVNLVSYTRGGSNWAVKSGNPTKFDPKNVCGRRIAIQSGTSQEKAVQKMSDECVAKGKRPVEFVPLARQTDATTRVAAGAVDATYSGTATLGYAVKMSDGRLEIIGKIEDAVLNGIAIGKSDKALTALVADGMNGLVADGTYKRILEKWGIENAAVPKAEINPDPTAAE